MEIYNITSEVKQYIIGDYSDTLSFEDMCTNIAESYMDKNSYLFLICYQQTIIFQVFDMYFKCKYSFFNYEDSDGWVKPATIIDSWEYFSDVK